MDTDSFLTGYLIGKKGKNNIKNNIWTPPDDWIPVPEPTDYEMYFLIYIDNDGENDVVFSFDYPLEYKDYFSTLEPNSPDYYNYVTVDWGDGTTSKEAWHDAEHEYSKKGMYLIKITVAKYNCLFNSLVHTTGTSFLIVKLGNEIIMSKNCLAMSYSLRYVKFNGDLPNGAFNGCYSLSRVENNTAFTKIPYGAFSGCYSLNANNLNFSKVTSIGGQAFQNSNIFEINAPMCESIGTQAFSMCYNLSKINVADSCTYGNNCFEYCYGIYPTL